MFTVHFCTDEQALDLDVDADTLEIEDVWIVFNKAGVVAAAIPTSRVLWVKKSEANQAQSA